MATILAADDEQAVLTLVALILRRAGHQVITARNGAEAVALFRSSPDRFDLIVTDVKMPVMDGLQAIRSARETRPGVRILCMTGFSEQAPPPGVGLLEKPFKPDDLCARVEGLLERK